MHIIHNDLTVTSQSLALIKNNDTMMRETQRLWTSMFFLIIFPQYNTQISQTTQLSLQYPNLQLKMEISPPKRWYFE